MPVPRRWATEEEIPEALREFCVQSGSGWVLDVEQGEGERSAADVQRALAARDNAKAERDKLGRELAELKELLGDLDIAQLPEVIDAYTSREGGDGNSGGDANAAQTRLKALEREKATLEREAKRLQDVTKDLEAADQRHKSLISQLTIEHGLTKAFQESGARPDAIPYLVKSAQDSWELNENNEPTPYSVVDGGTKIVATGPDGKPLTMEAQAKAMLAQYDFAVLPSNGSNARHQPGTGPGGGHTITASEARDNSRYLAAKENAAKAGAELMIVAD